MIKETHISVKYLQKDELSECWERSWILWKAGSSRDRAWLLHLWVGKDSDKMERQGWNLLPSCKYCLSLVWEEQRIYVPGRKHLMVGSCDPPLWTRRRTLTKNSKKSVSCKKDVQNKIHWAESQDIQSCCFLLWADVHLIFCFQRSCRSHSLWLDFSSAG